MIIKLQSSAAKAIPITVKEFCEALTSTWGHLAPQMRPPTAMGLAISGGVDSMALASLCAKVQSSGLYDWRFQAFVVDHGARADSGEEAKSVANILKEKGIDTKILQIEWPQGVKPPKISNFERFARIYRYQILGDACRDFNLKNLLLAHHEDDQYETVLMRLVGGHRSLGLVGMKPHTQIPECYGRYGVYRSGAVNKTTWEADHAVSRVHSQSLNCEDAAKALQKPASNVLLEDNFQLQKFTPTNVTAKARQNRIPLVPPLEPMRLEDGGISILRPLLQFSKERLIATCMKECTPWFEDHTNADPTLTRRNAIRHIYTKHSLPAILQKNAILALCAEAQRKKHLLHREALLFLDQCSIRVFEPRVGTVLVRFPKFSFSETTTTQKQRELGSILIKYAIDIVNPNETVNLANLGLVRNTVFSELSTGDNYKATNREAFTTSGVLFRRKPLQTPQSVVDTASKDRSNEQKQLEYKMPMQDDEWLLSRQPHNSQQHNLEFPPFSSYDVETDGWKFYDGRYWIRVFNHTMTPIKVRPLEKGDLRPFTTALGLRTRKAFEQYLKTMAPGDIRFTLPVIALTGASSNGGDWVLAIPTLGIALPDVDQFIHYEIGYKKVEWPGLQESYVGRGEALKKPRILPSY